MTHRQTLKTHELVQSSKTCTTRRRFSGNVQSCVGTFIYTQYSMVAQRSVHYVGCSQRFYEFLLNRREQREGRESSPHGVIEASYIQAEFCRSLVGTTAR